MKTELVERALRGEGPLFEAMLDERARELAVPPVAAEPAGLLSVLLLAGRAGRWALPLAEAARVEQMVPCTPLPRQPVAVMGLCLLAGRRCLMVDVDAALAGLPRRAADRPGHAVLLRRHPVALAADRAESIVALPPPEAGARVLADGSLLVAADQVVAALGNGERP